MEFVLPRAKKEVWVRRVVVRVMAVGERLRSAGVAVLVDLPGCEWGDEKGGLQRKKY